MGDPDSQGGRSPEVLLSRLPQWRKSDYTQTHWKARWKSGCRQLKKNRVLAVTLPRSTQIAFNFIQLGTNGWHVGALAVQHGEQEDVCVARQSAH